MRTATLLSLTLVTLACPATEPAPTDAAKPAADNTPATDKPPTTKPVDSKPTEPTTPDSTSPDSAIADKRAKAKAKIAEVDEAELHTRRTQMLAALNEGRKLVKDGDIPGGIAKYEALLAIAPNYAPALGELGWAEFKADKLDDAHAHTLLALSHAEAADKRGMLLYNLGRIAEARGQATQAIDHYQASLAARPNDTVAKQLETLRASAPTLPVPPPASTLPTGLPIVGKDLADTPAMCKAAGEGSGLCSADDNCQLMALPDSRTDLGVLELDDGMVRCWQPALQTPSGWLVFGTAVIGQYGSEIDQNVDDMSSRVEKNDAGEFLIIEFTDHVYERIWVDFEEEEVPDGTSTDREAMIICRRDGTPACTEAITTKHHYSGESDDGDDSETYSATVSLRGDKIIVADVVASRIDPSLDVGGWDGYMRLPAGEYAFSELAIAPP